MTENDRLVIRACLMTEIEATRKWIMQRPYEELHGGYRRMDPREEWQVKMQKALQAVEAMKIK